MLATIDIQRAVYKYLTELGISVKDTVPANSKLPYVQIGEFQVTDNRTKTNLRHDYILTLNVWCIDTSGYEFHNLMKQVVSIVESDITLDEYNLDQMDLDFLNTLKESHEHDFINHGIIQIRFTVSN